MSDKHTRFLWLLVWVPVGVAVLAALFVTSATAREVAFETFRTLFGIFSTPFILEATVALIGIFIVLAIARWRVEKEGDGWVYLAVQEPDGRDLPPAITKRLQGVILQDKPDPDDPAGTARLVIEGFLEMGMAAQAQREISESSDLPDEPVTDALRVRVMAANLDTPAALGLLRDSAARHPEARPLLRQAAQECAAWIEKHIPARRDEAAGWHHAARELSA